MIKGRQGGVWPYRTICIIPTWFLQKSIGFHALLLMSIHIFSADLDHYRCMLGEYSVSLFAQELGTKFPVYEKRPKK